MISCQQYDYIEIACMYRFPLKITLKDGSIVEGKALDTARDDDGHECLKIAMDEEKKLIILDEIALLEAMSTNPHFQSVSLI